MFIFCNFAPIGKFYKYSMPINNLAKMYHQNLHLKKLQDFNRTLVYLFFNFQTLLYEFYIFDHIF
jgi:hypothetical protein